jgi:hypothetical protein
MRDANGTPLDQAQATQAFARIVHEVFSGESWDTIEPYAEHVWAYTVQSEGGLYWRQVRDDVRAAWASLRAGAGRVHD